MLNVILFCSPENLKRSVDNILSKLRGTKKLDLFEVQYNVLHCWLVIADLKPSSVRALMQKFR